MGELTDSLNDLFGTAGHWGAYLLAVAGLGTLTMALLQAVKDMTPLRRWFQKFKMKGWLKEHACAACRNLTVSPDPDRAEKQLLLLATNKDTNAFYSLEVDKLCGQWNAASQIIIESPNLFLDIFQIMAAETCKADYDLLTKCNLPRSLPNGIEAELRVEEREALLQKRQVYLEARSRVAHQLQRAIDSFQIATAFRWKWMLQLASFVVSFAIALGAMAIHGTLNIGTALLDSAIAGFLAPVARDLLAALQKLRNGP